MSCALYYWFHAGSLLLTFTLLRNQSHVGGGFSRGQCSGSPTDLISAYATLDVPESEAMLYEPSYSRIAASAAALAGHNRVTSETFTCLYGFPREHMREGEVYSDVAIYLLLEINTNGKYRFISLPSIN